MPHHRAKMLSHLTCQPEDNQGTLEEQSGATKASAPIGRATALFFLSGELGKPVFGLSGERIGVLRDLIVPVIDEAFPTVRGLLAEVGGLPLPIYLPWDTLRTIDRAGFRLATSRVDLQPFQRRNGEVLLRKDLLDRQIVDVAGRRVVRVNDLQLAQYERILRLVAADVSTAGFLGRVLPSWLVDRYLQRRLIPWSQVEFFASEVPQVKLAIPHNKIARLHPADIAELVEEMAYPQASEVLASLSDQVAADTVEELEPTTSAAIITALPRQEAAEILDQMDPDDAVDLLAELPAAPAEELLAQMAAGPASNIRRLLSYPKGSAGGMMTTDFVAVPRDLSVLQVLTRLRRITQQPEEIFYLYVVDSEASGRLVGVLTLRHLVTSAPELPIQSVMVHEVIRARVTDPAGVVARTIAHYNLLALPVVDENDRLLGVITVDDAIDVILPEEWRRRMPKLFG